MVISNSLKIQLETKAKSFTRKYTFGLISFLNSNSEKKEKVKEVAKSCFDSSSAKSHLL